MKYDSLLLNCGGGIINPAAKSPQYTDSAALCIGIGGTGIAALSDLKGKIYQQLEPDNPGEPVPRYDAIQLLGIDSDDIEYRNYSGNRRLSNSEFFSIKKDNVIDFFATEQGKKLIKDDPRMNWLEIDEITAPLSHEGSGCIRQVGRYLLMNKADSLYPVIRQKCLTALGHRESHSLDVYIFAGLSGGTGSGCFLDTCYLVRKVLADYGLRAHIFGFFFLPDVVASKKEFSYYNPVAIAHNSNGYAALKELDYLMDLYHNGDEFVQDYGFCTIRTKEPPVDMCHLVSARMADGSMVPDGFRYAINVASDCAISYMYGVYESSVSMRGHLANVTRGVQGIPRRWGANLSYHVLGACSAEIPMIQINTYLASRFFRKFHGNCNIDPITITRKAVRDLVQELHPDADQMHNAVIANTPELELPEQDWKQLAKEPVHPADRLPLAWAECHNLWMAECDDRMTSDCRRLTEPLRGFGYPSFDDQSLISRLFRKLWDISVDPAFGPYYAAYLLKNFSNDLIHALTGEICKIDEREYVVTHRLYELADAVVACNRKLVDSSFISVKRAYHDYRHAVTDYLHTERDRMCCNKTRSVLMALRSQAEELYNIFFRPLTELLDNLRDTFNENAACLDSPDAQHHTADILPLLTLDELRPDLNDTVDQLNIQQVSQDFVQQLLEHSDSWLHNDENRISMEITQYMLNLFRAQVQQNMQDYLYRVYPQTSSQPASLAHVIEHELLPKIYRSAYPKFWCDPVYSISDPTHTFESSSFSVPGNCVALCSGAINFNWHCSQPCIVRQTGISDRIFALRLISGIPLFAYQGITKLKRDYDAVHSRLASNGSHLYAATGRGNSLEWRTWLPDPVPISYIQDPEVPHPAAELYYKAVQYRVIYEGDTVDYWGNPVTDYCIFTTPDVDLTDYQPENFFNGSQFLMGRCHAMIDQLKAQIYSMHDPKANPNGHPIRLRNKGYAHWVNPEVIRIDYFAKSPVLMELVRKELDKIQNMENILHTLQGMYTKHTATEYSSIADA